MANGDGGSGPVDDEHDRRSEGGGGERGPVRYGRDPTRETVRGLRLDPVPPCPPDRPLRDLLDRFKDDPMLDAIPVVDRGDVVGLLLRDTLMQAFASPFGHELNRRTTVGHRMDVEPLIVDLDDKLTDVSRRVTDRVFNRVYSPLVVRDGAGYVGLLSVHELLEKITQSQLSYARYCNPLTGLPGNISIQNEVTALLDAGEDFVFCHLDIDHFKAFNDHYGYERGDAMIRLVAETLSDCAGEEGFVGHIGGDDFVYVSTDATWKPRMERFLERVGRSFPELYDADDRARGGIEAENRSGQMQWFPLATMSVGALPCPAGRFLSHLEVAEAVSELKHMAKKRAGNALVVDRRRGR